MSKFLPLNFKVACHTDNVKQGTTFVAIPGTKLRGIDFIPIALQKGAHTIVVQQDEILSTEINTLIQKHHATILYVENTRKALAQLSAQAHDHAHKKLKIISVTGTKGKTTTCFLLEHMLKAAGYKTALISSVYNRIDDDGEISHHATPQPDYLHAFFALCVKRNVEYVILETAAQAHNLYRIEGLIFDAVVLTNFDQEHGEFYATMNDYFSAKCSILQHAKKDAPIFINADNDYCRNVPKDSRNIFYSLKNTQAHIQGSINNTALIINHETFHCLALTGLFNMYNMLAAINVAHFLNIKNDIIQKALHTFKAAPGRMERYALPNNAYCFIDYAHNPSSYAAVLGELRLNTHHLIVVFGAGGEREAQKRPMMGNIAAHYADHIILTSDNPRSENPEKIIQDILAGIPDAMRTKIIIEFDREKAILKAYELSQPHSFIALLGKGNDEYQIIQGVKYPFSERKIIASLI